MVYSYKSSMTQRPNYHLTVEIGSVNFVVSRSFKIDFSLEIHFKDLGSG